MANKLIVTIVAKEKGEIIAKAACNAGAGGGTILPGHGLGVKMFFGITIEPEKDIVLTLVDESKVQTIIDAILKEINLKEANQGIAFVVPVEQVVGLRQN